MSNHNMNLILERLNESKEDFVVDYDLNDMYTVGIYPLSSKTKMRTFKTMAEAKKYAIKYLKSLKGKKQIVANNRKYVEIAHDGKVVERISYNDVVKDE